MGKIATKSYCNSIASGAFGGDLSRCPTKSEISSTDKFDNSKLGSYAANQLVEEDNIVIKPEVLFTVTIDNRNSGYIRAGLEIAYRFQLDPTTYAFGKRRAVGSTNMKGILTHNTGPFDTTEQYGNSNVLLWTGPLGFNYSYSAIIGTSGIIYSSAGSGTYNGTNPDGAVGTNLKYITLFSQPINAGDSISLTIIIH